MIDPELFGIMMARLVSALVPQKLMSSFVRLSRLTQLLTIQQRGTTQGSSRHVNPTEVFPRVISGTKENVFLTFTCRFIGLRPKFDGISISVITSNPLSTIC
jgi:hypothetical protein